MTASLLPLAKQQYFDAAGDPLVGGKIYTYAAGTSTPKVTYQDAAATILNTNPIILDSRGECLVFWTGSYKIVVKDSLDNTIYTVDNVTDLASILSSTSSASNGAGAIGYDADLAYASGTVGKKLKETVSPEDYYEVADGSDWALAINRALAVADRVIGTGSYTCLTNVVLPAGKYLHLDTVTLSAPIKAPSGNDTTLSIRNLGVANAFSLGGYMLELGANGDTTRYDAFKLRVELVNGKSPDSVTRAHVIRNYNRTFSDFEMIRVRDVKNVYTCDQPAVALGDNRVHGALIENADYGLYLYGTVGGVNHVEHHILEYQFVAGCQYGAVYARGRAHYQHIIGAYDFNGQSLVQLGAASSFGLNIGDTATGSSSGATATVTAVQGNTLLGIRTSGTFTTSDTVNGVAVTAVTVYGGGTYLDFISQTQSDFARHRLECPYLTNVYGNNQEDWVTVQAVNATNLRARIAGHEFYASSTEQYMQLMIANWSLRFAAIRLLELTATRAAMRNANGAGVFIADSNFLRLTDGSGIDLVEWNSVGGLDIGKWVTTQNINILRDLVITGGAWDSVARFRMGPYFLWVDSSGRLRIKNGAPAGDTDGTVVGTQT